MKDNQIRQPVPRREGTKPTPRQRAAQILMLVLVVLLIAGIWLFRMPKNYVNIFIDHYEGTTSVVSEMKGIEPTGTEQALLLPLQQRFDDWKETHLRDEVEVTARDGAVLKGGLYDAKSHVTVIMFHTFDGSSTSSDYLMADYFADKGYNILLPDSRDHGESGGEHATYGLLEGDDVVCWIRMLLERYGSDHQIILQGDTLGANAALAGAAAAERDPALADAVRFVVAESPIDNLYDEAVYLMKNQFHLPAFLVGLGDWFAVKSLGCSMEAVDLTEMTRGCQVPALVLQGTGDTVVDPVRVQDFCDNYSGPLERVVADCGHGMVYPTCRQACEAALDKMIRDCLN